MDCCINTQRKKINEGIHDNKTKKGIYTHLAMSSTFVFKWPTNLRRQTVSFHNVQTSTIGNCLAKESSSTAEMAWGVEEGFHNGQCIHTTFVSWHELEAQHVINLPVRGAENSRPHQTVVQNVPVVSLTADVETQPLNGRLHLGKIWIDAAGLEGKRVRHENSETAHTMWNIITGGHLGLPGTLDQSSPLLKYDPCDHRHCTIHQAH